MSARRRGDRGEITLAFLIVGMWIAAVFAGGVTHAVVTQKRDAVHAGLVCFPDPAAPEFDLSPNVTR